MKKLAQFLVLTVAPMLWAGISNSRSPEHALPDLPALLADTDSLEIFEGLPHHMFESARATTEKKTKKVFQVSGDWFYEKILLVSTSDKDWLDEIFRKFPPHIPFRGEKLCGGFHADYLLEWQTHDTPAVRILICFGCGEMKVVAKEVTFRTDLTSDGYKRLAEVLQKYRQERPCANQVQVDREKLAPLKIDAPKIKIEAPGGSQNP
jgi:hypothetical protein